MASSKRVGVGVSRSILLDYLPPGPRAMEYIASDAPITLIMGPEGSGKSIASGAKMLWAAEQQAPSPHDGVIRVKGYIIRGTYRDLWDKTIPTYWKCWPKDLDASTWTGGKGEPATHVIRINYPDGRKFELIHEFRAISDITLADFVAGLEATWIYLNEVNTLPANVLSAFYRRCGRYPAPDDRPNDGLKRWFGVFGDFNAEDEAHWLFHSCMDEKKDGLKFIMQPSGFSPEAENMNQLRKIDPNYYENKAKMMERWEVRRMIENRWGFSRSGEPVYADDWDDEVHVAAAPIEPNPRKPVFFCTDGGGRPGGLFVQEGDDGCAIIFDEIQTPDDAFWDAETYGKRCLARFKTKWPNCKIDEFFPDPSGRARVMGAGSGLDDEAISWINQFAQTTFWRPQIPHTNDPQERLKSVRRRLRLGRRGVLVSPSCVLFRSGMNSGYKLKKADPKDGHVTEHERIRKDRYSTLQDAFQYYSLCRPLPGVAWHASDVAGSDYTPHGPLGASAYDLPVILG